MGKQKALVDADLNIPFSFVTFDSSFSNKKLLLLVEILSVCAYVCA